MKPKYKQHDIIRIGITRYTISGVDAFGTTPHYGMVWTTDRVNYSSGWFPVEFVDAMIAPAIELVYSPNY